MESVEKQVVIVGIFMKYIGIYVILKRRRKRNISLNQSSVTKIGTKKNNEKNIL